MTLRSFLACVKHTDEVLPVQFDERGSSKEPSIRGLLYKRFLIAAVAMISLQVLGTERITIDRMTSHYPWNGKVDCTYSLRGLEIPGYVYQGVFTLSVEKEGLVVYHAVTNDITVQEGTFTNTFDCATLFGEGVYPNGGIVVDLIKSKDAIGTPIGVKGDVLLIDISGGSSAKSYPTGELSDVDLGIFNCTVYKTNKIVLRKIPAGSYYCKPGANQFETVIKQLTTKGFYIGLFPVTQRQYEQVMGVKPSRFSTDAADDIAACRPVERVSWNTIRGSVAAGAEITKDSADSFLKRLVEKTEISGFDLPTEAQWEIACRAGSAASFGSYWDGTMAVELASSSIGEIAWYSGNALSRTHAVGGKKANLWGLYDMQGNVWEWCRDIYISTYNLTYVDEPCTEVTTAMGGTRVARGGCYYYSTEQTRPSYRDNLSSGSVSSYYGFRLSKNLP